MKEETIELSDFVFRFVKHQVGKENRMGGNPRKKSLKEVSFWMKHIYVKNVIEYLIIVHSII